MRRFLLTVVALLISLSAVANGQSIEVELETSYGTERVLVPEDPNELKEAFLEVSRAYLEERYDHELLIVSMDDLLYRVDQFEGKVDELGIAFIQYMQSVDQFLLFDSNLAVFQMIRFKINAGLRHDVINNIAYPKIGVGLVFFNKVTTDFNFELYPTFSYEFILSLIF
jgi:hypothetical protein